MKHKFLYAFLCAIAVCILSVLPAAAQGGQVTYNGDAGQFVFAPGSGYSLTDLFTDFKEVMPGDSISQNITIKNEASEKVDVKVFMRSLGAQPGYEDFLSQLKLTVETQDGTVLFDAPADETAGLTDWVYLGCVYSGGTAELKVTLEVPVTLDNSYKNMLGYLDWEFKVEEYPVEMPTATPGIPDTGDQANLAVWTWVCIAAVVMLSVMTERLWLKNKER